MTTEEERAAWEAIVMTSALPGHVKNPIEMAKVYACLKAIENGQPEPEVAFKFNIPSGILKRWVQRAKILMTIKTGRSSPRIIGRERYDPIKLILTPAPLKERTVKNQAAALFFQAGIMFVKNPARLLRFLDIYLSKVTSARSIIRFTPNQSDERDIFIAVGTDLLGKNDWIIHTNKQKYVQDIQRLELGFNSKQFISTSYNGVGFTVAKPDAANVIQGSNMKVPSSGVLRHAIHMLLITWPSGHLPNDQDPIRSELETYH